MEKVKELFGKIKELVKKRKVLFIILACVLVLAIGGLVAVLLLNSDAVDGGSTGEKTTYTVSIHTKGGMAMSEIDVYIYDSKKLDNMQDYAKTNEEGEVSFNLPKSKKYAIVLSGAPKGYEVKKSYKFDGEKAEIELTSSLIKDEDISTATLGLGDIMYDFTVTTSDGKELKLSDVLKEKKLVVLNFWYTTCSWCLKEFTIIDEVYKD